MIWEHAGSLQVMLIKPKLLPSISIWTLSWVRVSLISRSQSASNIDHLRSGPWELLVQEFLPPLLTLVIDTYIPHLLRCKWEWQQIYFLAHERDNQSLAVDLTTFEKPHSKASLNTSVMKKHFAFVLLNNLVFPSFITGGLSVSAILLGTSNSRHSGLLESSCS